MRFADIIGQEDVKRKLRSAFRDGRIAHAILFLGPEGAGGLPLALAFAQYISCGSRTELDSCGTCGSCRKFSSFQHADLHFAFPYFKKPNKDETISDDYMDMWRAMLEEDTYFGLDRWRSKLAGEGRQFTIPVSEAANIIRKLSLTSYEGSHKFMIVWGADMLKNDSANKLLKTLEEPPDQTIFLLIASNSENMLPTILSRTQVMQVPALQDAEIAHALEATGIETATARNIAHYANGNWYRASRLAHAQDSGSEYTELFVRWMRLCYGRDVLGIVKWVNEMAELSRDDQKMFIQYALEQIRHNLMLNYVGESLARMNDVEKEFSVRFAPFINDLNAIELMEVLNEAWHDLGRNAYVKTVLADLSFRTHGLLRREGG